MLKNYGWTHAYETPLWPKALTVVLEGPWQTNALYLIFFILRYFSFSNPTNSFFFHVINKLVREKKCSSFIMKAKEKLKKLSFGLLGYFFLQKHLASTVWKTIFKGLSWYVIDCCMRKARRWEIDFVILGGCRRDKNACTWYKAY